MVSRSYSNLLGLASGEPPALGRISRRIPRIMTVPGIISDIDDDPSESVCSDPSSSSQKDRIIMVANQLPIRAHRKSDNNKNSCSSSSNGWIFSWDDNSLLLQMKDGLGDDDVEVIYVGCLKEEIHPNEQDEVSQILLETFNCVPTFVPPDLFSRYYHGFCKQQLWPLFHYMLPLSPDLGCRFNRSLWQAYVSVNKIFADRIMESVLSLPETEAKVAELIKQYCDQGKIMLLGVDDMDIFKGISLKLLAMEQLLLQHPKCQGKVVLVQIALPARGRGKDVKEVQEETYSTVKRINETFGKPGYDPVVLIDEPLKFYERIAYYVVAECCLVTAVRDGMNLIPYEYIISRQGNERLNKVLGLEPSTPKKSMLVVSEFIGCSPSLSGAIRVNPWNIDDVADAMECALAMAEPEKQLRHEKHYRYVSTHHVGYWAHSFLQDLERTCREHVRRRCWGIGFGLSFRVVALDPNFRKLSMEHIVSAYKRTTTRAILLDYDGTLMPQASIDKSPSSKSLDILNSLCRDKNNMVFIVSAKSRKTLAEWFSPCDKLGIAAEHGYFLSLKGDDEWETCVQAADCGWKQIAEPVMKQYMETTDGSYIEDKETALVWCYEDADPDFGSCQAKELLDHLESVLANEPVTVKRGQNFVEVKPQGVSKGLVAKRLLSTMQERGMLPDFVLCIGDDRSDEDMFEVIISSVSGPLIDLRAEVFACTVGRKPSKAKYYLDDTVEICRLMQGLASVSDQMLSVPT
ncbi:Alpha,alpha-trehalose-phosphate synthase 5 [Hibiscus syriacus]|uniref:Alpha,alpha-trehalose-phosphate synthase 5 n=1 Tax=Hibiscus syriacus TaxID=106335 RepID=A0A6A3CS91_HIBSY|nr:Alpha,alpha-trehalose-phosphate synthase 5 [Hibiscus syriacus]